VFEGRQHHLGIAPAGATVAVVEVGEVEVVEGRGGLVGIERADAAGGLLAPDRGGDHAFEVGQGPAEGALHLRVLGRRVLDRAQHAAAPPPDADHPRERSAKRLDRPGGRQQPRRGGSEELVADRVQERLGEAVDVAEVGVEGRAPDGRSRHQPGHGEVPKAVLGEERERDLDDLVPGLLRGASAAARGRATGGHPAPPQ